MTRCLSRALAAVFTAVLALPLTMSCATAAQPAAILFFTGNTYGNIAPCPS